MLIIPCDPLNHIQNPISGPNQSYPERPNTKPKRYLIIWEESIPELQTKLDFATQTGTGWTDQKPKHKH